MNKKITTTKGGDCLICNRIKLIKEIKNPYFVMELKTGYVVIGDHQFFRGYTLFLCKKHKTELHQLDPKFKKQFLWEMSLVAEAVHKTFKPKKLNYELLGNTDQHMHWHIFPRYKNDPLPADPTWCIKENIRKAEKIKPNKKSLDKLRISLKNNLEKVIKKSLRLK